MEEWCERRWGMCYVSVTCVRVNRYIEGNSLGKEEWLVRWKSKSIREACRESRILLLREKREREKHQRKTDVWKETHRRGN